MHWEGQPTAKVTPTPLSFSRLSSRDKVYPPRLRTSLVLKSLGGGRKWFCLCLFS